MNWLLNNWFWLLVGIVFVLTHVLGHRGHGGHGRRSDGVDKDATPAGKEDSKGSSKQSGHQH